MSYLLYILFSVISLSLSTAPLQPIAFEDPYRWLEEMESEEVINWVEAQEAQTNAYFAEDPMEEEIEERLESHMDQPHLGIPYIQGGNLYYTYRSLEDSTSVVYKRDQEGWRQRLLDFSEIPRLKGHNITGHLFSPDESLVAFGQSESGSDQEVWQVMDLQSKELLPVSLKGIAFTQPFWDHEFKGLYFLDSSNEDHVLYYQPLEGEKEEIIRFKDAKRKMIGGFSLFDGQIYYSILDSQTELHETFLFDLETNETKRLIEPTESFFYLIGFMEGRAIYHTNDSAPMGRLISIDFDAPGRENWIELIAETKASIEAATLMKDYIAIGYLDGAISTLKLFNYEGQLDRSLALPGLGTVAAPAQGLNLSGSYENNILFYPYTDMTTPMQVHAYDAENDESWLFYPEEQSKTEKFVTTRHFVKSEDGTEVPLFITHREGIELDGSHPTVMYGYGGFKTPILPHFDPLVMVWLEMGGVYVTVNVRGGGEYGEAWHREGTKEKKKNSFNDFIAAAEWLIDEGYTDQTRLAIHGRSNGGLLVGGTVVQRPDLFKAAIPQVGVFDLMRFHLYTVGWAWIPEYGDPEDPIHQQFLLEHSPYHNVKLGQDYPSLFITTADNDDRVVPLHSYKFAARVKEAKSDADPLLLRVYKNRGHGRGGSFEGELEECREILTFLYRELQL